MSSSGPRFNPACTSLRALTLTSRPELLPSRIPTRGPNIVITKCLTSIPRLVD